MQEDLAPKIKYVLPEMQPSSSAAKTIRFAQPRINAAHLVPDFINIVSHCITMYFFGSHHAADHVQTNVCT